MMTTKIYARIDYAGAMAALDRLKRNSRLVGGVEIPDFSGLPAVRRAELDTQIQRLATECGCKLGAAVAIGATILYAAAARFGLIPFAHGAIAHIAFGVATFILGTVLGKLGSMKRNQARLQAIADHIRAELLAREMLEGAPNQMAPDIGG